GYAFSTFMSTWLGRFYFISLYKAFAIRYSPTVMPIIKSAIKRVRQQVKRRSRNLIVLRAVKADVRAVTDAVTAADTKTATETFKAAVSELDRAVKKGVLHKNAA